MILLQTLFITLLLLLSSNAHTQSPGGLSFSTDSETTEQAATLEDNNNLATTRPDEVKTLLRLLSNKNVVDWLQDEFNNETQLAITSTDNTFRIAGARRLQKLRSRARDVGLAITELHELPGKVVTRWQSKATPVESLRSIIYLLIFLFIGFGLEWLYWCYASLRLHQLELSNVAGLKASARRALNTGLLRLAGATIFSLGCIGTFLFFDWTELTGQVMTGALFVAVILRILLVITRVIFAPASEHLRMVPVSTQTAKRCVKWVFIVFAVGLSSRMMADVFVQIGIDKSARISVYFLSSAVLAVTVIFAVWVWRSSGKLQTSTTSTTGYALSSTVHNPYLVPLALTVLTLLVLTLDTLAMHQIKWLLLMFALLLPAISICKTLVDYYFDRALSEVVTLRKSLSNTQIKTPSGVLPDNTETPDATITEERELQSEVLPFNIYRPVTQRLARMVLIISAVLVFFTIVDLPLWSIYRSDQAIGQIVSAVLDVTAILLLADLLWVWAKTVIDRRLSEFEAPAHGQLPGPGARMATLLPLFRKVIFSVIAVLVVLVLLSSFGVNIAPLLAGAGVIGIAVGFGAQALVKDVVSGIFFLLEDAFRVGEYIEAGELRGTVESISLRSLRVRHHLGAVHTIPYGELTSLTNHSRDWAIIKMEFRVPFDTDLKLVKKIVKKIGAELQQNEVYGHHIIEPLKSQGVRRMEEFNMVVGVKFMSEPGQQWTIRRDAYQGIRDAFDQHGLSFAERSVKVEVVGEGSVGRDVVAGAAQDAIDEQLQTAPKIVDDTP